MNLKRFSFCFTILVIGLILVQSDAYKPVFLIHGLNDNPSDFQFLASYIKKAHPGTVIKAVNLYDDLLSYFPLWEQSRRFADDIRNDPSYTEDGVHILGYSQGGLIARAIPVVLGNHSIHNLICLSSPLMGEYGVYFSKGIFQIIEKELAYKIFYTRIGQLISIGNYWNDPHHRNLYLKKNVFLPVLNNQVKHSSTNNFKKSFLRLKNVVLIGGPDDGVILPWQSSQFGFYDSNEKIVPMERQEVYKKDLFGLQTLDISGRLNRFTMSGIDHFQWPHNATVIDKFILPFLD